MPNSFGVPEVKANRLPSKNSSGARLAVAFDEFGLVIEQIQMRRRAGEVQIDHPLGRGLEVGFFRSQRIDRARGGRESIPLKERTERRSAQAETGPLQKMPAGQVLQLGKFGSHEDTSIRKGRETAYDFLNQILRLTANGTYFGYYPPSGRVARNERGGKTAVNR